MATFVMLSKKGAASASSWPARSPCPAPIVTRPALASASRAAGRPGLRFADRLVVFDSNRGQVNAGLLNEYSAPGGHVIWTDNESIEPATVTAQAAGYVPDIIRWVLENRTLQIASGDVTVGHKTVNNWRRVPIIGRVPLPNTYFGYAAWKP